MSGYADFLSVEIEVLGHTTYKMQGRSWKSKPEQKCFDSGELKSNHVYWTFEFIFYTFIRKFTMLKH